MYILRTGRSFKKNDGYVNIERSECSETDRKQIGGYDYVRLGPLRNLVVRKHFDGFKAKSVSV